MRAIITEKNSPFGCNLIPAGRVSLVAVVLACVAMFAPANYFTLPTASAQQAEAPPAAETPQSENAETPQSENKEAAEEATEDKPVPDSAEQDSSKDSPEETDEGKDSGNEPESGDKSDQPTASDDENGEDDLAKATILRLKVKQQEQATNKGNLSDMEAVIQLFDSAIKKGLSKESEASANELLQGVLFEYAQRAASPIFNPRGPGKQWQFYRERSLKKLERLDEMSNEWSETYILMAKLYAMPNGDRGKAIAAASKAVKFAGEDVNQLSEALFIRGQLSEDDRARMADFNQALKINPNNLAALQKRAAILMQTEQYELAIDDFEKLIEITNGNPLAYQQLIEAMLATKRVDEALEVTEEALSRDDKQPALHSLQAKIYVYQLEELSQSQESEDELSDDEKKEQEEELAELEKLALDSLGKAIEMNPKDVDSLLMRAGILMSKNDSEAAKRDVERLLVLAPGSVRGIYYRSIIAASEGRFVESAKDLELLVRNDPNNLIFRLQLAGMYSAGEMHEKAIKIYKEIIVDDNTNVDALRGLADAELGAGQHEAARATYEKTLDADPEDDHVLNNLAWLLATSPEESIRDGDRSVELGLKACELTEYEKPHILSTLAAGYAETGDFENARKWSAKAVELAEGEELEALEKELESYKKNEPWREKQESKDGGQLEDGGGDFEF